MPPADLHALLLEEYFFSWVDRGVAVGATPLFTGVVEGEDGFILKYTPWTLSSSTTWKIPVCYVIRVINRPDSFFTIGYVNFATNNQVMEITSDGNCKVTKLGFSKTRPLATPAPTPRTP